ncbi:DUF262 domain-containing protein [Paenibacillus chibensis]|uniref:DUF262 domain-containing protein n=1 Tax=Paenibacillus chibensis TaxID=59846 RepID=UPI000FD8C3AC|nr:DUF262 domain-containing protein [Paenibacillus chibensis]MEC0371141.1 DUF262 domain-containing protein [Paenibacillus chibensis]
MDVTPDKQNIDKLFSGTTYYIDFYQRQYKWTSEPVIRLLDDIMYKFNLEYTIHKSSDIQLDKLIEKYSWYYLNTYVTNLVDGKVFIVDGQQRLTTLTLILIKLYQLAKDLQSDLIDWISSRIVGFSGFQKDFWMNHEQHKKAVEGLYKGEEIDKIDVSTGITAVNMVDNFKTISGYMKKEIGNDKHRFESFVFFFLKRLVLINLNVEQTDVPMIFEVINDRGVKLKPYEILKGKLLGQIDKDEMDHFGFNELWDTKVHLMNEYAEDEIDEFFIYYLRAKFANTVGDSKKFDQAAYHRTIFMSEVNHSLGLQHNPNAVKHFLNNEFKYYSDLYLKILKYQKDLDSNYPHVYYNKLIEMDSQFLLILSACSLRDQLEDEKIKLVSYHVDRLFTLLQLQRSYDSNDFNEMIYKICSQIREKTPAEIEAVFEASLLAMISEVRGTPVTEPVSYPLFRDTGYELNKRFKRYFFARIEEFLASGTKMNMKHSITDLVQKTGSVSGFHIEHILAENSENLQAFGNDRERFERERNRLGGLLLLKGKDNISSNNEAYAKKLKTYANSLYWNETLRQDSYKAKKDFDHMMNTYKLQFRPMDIFGADELEERHRLLFNMIKLIWI